MPAGRTDPSAIGGICGVIVNEELAVVGLFATAGMVEGLFYGIHFTLFCICLSLFIHRRRAIRLPFFIPAAIMFALATADVAITFRILSYGIPNYNHPEITKGTSNILKYKTTLFVASNCVGELTLLLRCYGVWDRSKYVLAFCSLFVVADTIWGFLGLGPGFLVTSPNKFVPIYVWNIFAINILLTMITVTRLFWMSKFAKRAFGQRQSIYDTAIVILLETGLLYSVCLLLFLLYPTTKPSRTYLIIIILRVVGIVPTLLIVQVGLGSAKAKTSGPTTLSNFHVRTNTIALDTLDTSMAQDEEGIRRNGLHINPQNEETDIATLSRGDMPKLVFEPLTVDIRTQDA